MNSLSVLVFAAVIAAVFGIRDFAQNNGNGRPNIPSTPGINGGNDRGTWNVGVNKNKGRGPQIHADGQGRVWSSKNGKVNVDAGGSWDAGKGRKPDYGGHVNVGGRWRRFAEPEEPGKRGSVSATVEAQRGQKPRYNIEAERKIWQTRDGNGRLSGYGNYNWGGNQRPNYGGGIRYTHRFRRDADIDEVADINDMEGIDETRWRRSAEPQESEKRGSVSAKVEAERGQKPRYSVEAESKIWQTRDGNGRLSGYGNYNWGGNQKPDYGAGIRYTHRFRRDADVDDIAVIDDIDDIDEARWRRSAEPQKSEKSGSVSAKVEAQRGQKPRYSVEAEKKIWQTRDGNGRLSGYGNYNWGGNQRRDYGAGIRYTHRFRRDAEPEMEQLEFDEE